MEDGIHIYVGASAFYDQSQVPVRIRFFILVWDLLENYSLSP